MSLLMSFCFGLHLHSSFFRLVPAEILLCCCVSAILRTQRSFATDVEGFLVVLLVQH